MGKLLPLVLAGGFFFPGLLAAFLPHLGEFGLQGLKGVAPGHFDAP
jgi:hypothetical protein